MKSNLTQNAISRAAAILGRKGGQVRGPTKARATASQVMKAYWASPAAAHRRKKPLTSKQQHA